MKTVFTAMASFSGCSAVRWYLDRSSRREAELLGGRVRLKSLWNDGAAFSLPLPRGILIPASAAILGALWTERKPGPFSTGLILGGGLSNLYERVRYGRVYDYVQFPKAPGRLKQYVFNLADFAVAGGGILLLAGRGTGKAERKLPR